VASELFGTVVEMLRQANVADDDATLSAVELRQSMEAMVGALPPVEGTVVEAVMAGGVPSEWVRPATAVATDACVFYLHGGGYVLGSVNTHRALASHLAWRTGLPVLVVDYRLGPEHPFPAALDDALAAYEWVLAQGFAADRVVVAGDSAGGGLTLATLLALRDRNLPLPAAAVPISPWTDLTLSGDSMDALDAQDPMVRRPGLQRMADWYLGDQDAKDPLASPVFADPTGLPPMLIHVGEIETLLDDATRFAAAAIDAGVDVTLEVWPEMIHVWHAFGPMVPESDAAVTRIAEFVAEQLHLPAPPVA
jgi:monoterpene epsilon-lactone hydrolase